MEEIKVGEYVRTKKGIRKIIKIDEDNNYYIDKTYVNDFRQAIDCITENCIIGKPSKHIINLIEVGDYINGQLVEKIHKKEKDKIYYEFLQNEDGSYEVMEMCEIKNIKSIVTKEQFESMEYRLED